MLITSNNSQQLEVAEDVAYQQDLLAEKIGSKYEIMTIILKQDWKLVGMTRKTMTNLIRQLQPFMMAINRSFNNNNWESMLLAINKYWR